MSELRIKGWSRFQHYKTGKNASTRPDWIKVYTRLLDDIEWHELDGKDAKSLMMLWMLASENGGELPPVKTIAFRLRASEKEINSVLGRLGHWIESTSYENPRTEEKRREEEREENIQAKPSPNGSGRSEEVFEEEEAAIKNYNTTAEALGLPIATKITQQRKRALKARLFEHELDGWNQALRNLCEMPFCYGDNKQGWRVTFDWLLKPSNFTKILEMAYARPEGEQH